MGSKNRPGKFDCYTNAGNMKTKKTMQSDERQIEKSDEPSFVLLGRDPTAYLLVAIWVKLKLRMKQKGLYKREGAWATEAMLHAAWLERYAKEQGMDTEVTFEVMKEVLQEIHEKGEKTYDVP